jgi:hypothetical protein
MHRLAKIGVVLAFVLAVAGVSAGIVAAQSGEDNTPTPSASVATATEESATPADDGSTDEDKSATPEAEEDSTGGEERSGDGHLCPDKEEDAAESTTETTA